MSGVSDCMCCGEHIMVNDVDVPELCDECIQEGCDGSSERSMCWPQNTNLPPMRTNDMGRKRVLTERHPLVGKFNELCDKAIDLGIQLTIGSYGEMFLEYDGKVYIVTTEGHNEHQFPPAFECEIIQRIDE